MIDISIIIPVYNSRTTIERAIESVLAQKDVKVEVVCIDDGSTDDSCELIMEQYGKDGRVKLFRQPNSGAGAARNSGIRRAAGEYVGFLDADDYLVSETALSQMIHTCREKNVRICGAQMILENEGGRRPSASSERVKVLAQDGVLAYADFQFDYDFTSYIYEKKLLDDLVPCFPELRYYEDPVFLVKAMWKAEKFAVIDVDYYCYVLSPKPRTLTKEQCSDLVDGLAMNMEFARFHDLDILLQNLHSRLIYEYGDWIYRYVQASEELRWKIRRFGLAASEGMRLVEREYKRDYATYIQEKISGKETFFLYGNGAIAHTFLKYAEETGLVKRFSGFVVTNLNNQSDDDCIQSVSDYAESERKGLLIVAVSGVYIAEIVDLLKAYDICNYEILDLSFVSELCESMEKN